MGSLDLLLICSLSFLSVFVVLSLLALVMRAIILIFPFKELSANGAVYAAIAGAAAQTYPGKKIVKIEEQK